MNVRYWTNESRANHIVESYEKSSDPDFEYVIHTECGLTYHTQTPGHTFDADKPESEQTTYPREEARHCGRCGWGNLF